MGPRPTTIYCSNEVHAAWPEIAESWAAQYPQLFDSDDVRLVRRQPRFHFPEWFVAIHLFQRDGAVSLLEKYAYRNHQRKREAIREYLEAADVAFLESLVKSAEVQPPDLLVILPNRAIRFAEAKGPGDRLSPRQKLSHLVIEKRFGASVEVFHVRVLERRRGRTRR